MRTRKRALMTARCLLLFFFLFFLNVTICAEPVIVPDAEGVYSALPLPKRTTEFRPAYPSSRPYPFSKGVIVPKEAGVYRLTPPPPYYKHRFASGIYLGGSVGYGSQSGINSDPFLQSPSGAGDILVYKPHNPGGEFGQISVGYMINRYCAIEVGAMHFSRGTYHIDSYSNYPLNASNLIGTAKTQVTNRVAADALLKIFLPLGNNGWSVFVGGGAAREQISFNSDYSNLPASNVASDNLTTTATNSAIVPVIAGGVSYAVTPHFGLLITYYSLAGKGKLQKNYVNHVPTAHAFSFGLIGIL